MEVTDRLSMGLVRGIIHKVNSPLCRYVRPVVGVEHFQSLSKDVQLVSRTWSRALDIVEDVDGDSRSAQLRVFRARRVTSPLPR